MSSSLSTIIVKDISKCFQIYDRPEDRLKQSIVPRIKNFFGLPAEKYFHEFWALKNINIQIEKGETVGIVGRNGSGKSTLLQIICGTLMPTGGKLVTRGRIAALLELGSGFNPEFTGKENIYLYGTILGLSKSEIDNKYEDILNFADIGEFIYQPIKTYSSGMAVRLAFAVAINVDPDILVVDEALAVGDELFQRKCFSKIETIKKNGATILFVSHSGSMITELCDRAILIDAGEKLTEGIPKNIIAAYQKLLYAPHEKKGQIRNLIRDGRYLTSETLSSPDSAKLTSDDFVQESYDPSLVPSSTIEYASQGAIIQDAHIELMTGQRVNNLVFGRTYNYVYLVEFEKPAINVRFGMLVKTVSGFELGGAVSAANSLDTISHVEGGKRYRVTFSFQCALNPGTYFLNAGVLGVVGEVETYLHRVIDITMLRVMPITNNLSTMHVNFAPVATIEMEG